MKLRLLCNICIPSHVNITQSHRRNSSKSHWYTFTHCDAPPYTFRARSAGGENKLYLVSVQFTTVSKFQQQWNRYNTGGKHTSNYHSKYSIPRRRGSKQTELLLMNSPNDPRATPAMLLLRAVLQFSSIIAAPVSAGRRLRECWYLH